MADVNFESLSPFGLPLGFPSSVNGAEMCRVQLLSQELLSYHSYHLLFLGCHGSHGQVRTQTAVIALALSRADIVAQLTPEVFAGLQLDVGLRILHAQSIENYLSACRTL